MALIATMYRLFVILVLTMPILAWAAADRIEGCLPVGEYAVRPDPRDCAPYPECGGYFLYEIIQTPDNDLCTADLPFAAYVVRLMCPAADGSLVEFYPSCSKPIFGDIEADPDYKNYRMLVSPSCEQ
jgi:hypothetical protein